jgi:sporulation protein YlmC with PRC-barrel domain
MAHDKRTHVTGPTADEAIRPLVHSHDLDHFKIPDGDPDPRGWDVRTADGRDLGKVSDLLVDTETGRVRYLELAVDKDAVKAGAREYYLIPIGEARLDDARDDVVVNLSAADLADVPVYERGRVSRTYEQSLRTYVRDRPGRRRAADAAGPADRDVDFYGGAEYDDRSFFGSRRSAGRTVADRLATAADDLKDRVDGNPASRPGRDATDRPTR